eukprot:gnl/TRDRNA2_/TRDRNA2_186307_c0_seq1.p2 gnl/TRDRNA2_/TRDRNA2_186307_c0~~gnl/TRDRNA2_/TRDRNA2_186307_c0_seq1.p2  ORF type:complete len:110 (+),score=26.08 gnl/TRDRNA2_/TRDRNA2_186307_c0_seq1:95-424(+)
MSDQEMMLEALVAMSEQSKPMRKGPPVGWRADHGIAPGSSLTSAERARLQIADAVGFGGAAGAPQAADPNAEGPSGPQVPFMCDKIRIVLYTQAQEGPWIVKTMPSPNA